jgi:hypothetical protein
MDEDCLIRAAKGSPMTPAKPRTARLPQAAGVMGDPLAIRGPEPAFLAMQEGPDAGDSACGATHRARPGPQGSPVVRSLPEAGKRRHSHVEARLRHRPSPAGGAILLTDRLLFPSGITEANVNRGIRRK